MMSGETVGSPPTRWAEWVFYVGQDEVFRIPVSSVVGIAKT